MPRYDVVERHRTRVVAPPDLTYAAVRRVDLGRSTTVRVLFGLRGMRRTARITLDDLLARGFVLLGEEPGEELVLGLVGRFWTPGGGLRQVAPDAFATFEEPGFARTAWNFRVSAARDNSSTLSTETRVLCTDERARRSFRRYWRLVRPFSGAIRRRSLELIKRDAELAYES